MAAPNLNAVTTVTSRTLSGALTISVADLVTNAASSNKVFKITSLFISNITPATATTATISFYDASAAASRALSPAISVPAKSTLVVISKDTPLNLEEGDKITGFAGANSSMEWVCSYEELS